MGNRNYNIFFSLHTVSGIVVSIALYIIFLAGAYTLFTVEVSNWETQSPYTTTSTGRGDASLSQFDFDGVFPEIEKRGIRLYGRDMYLYKWGNDRFTISLTGSKDSLATKEDKKSVTLHMDAFSGELRTSVNNTVGGILYGLHFFSQAGTPGYYFAGAVSMLFLFALISGVFLHWKKIISNFYLFRPFGKWKTVWTDAHTLTGVIGFPFQFMYALTGAFFCLGILVNIPGKWFYDGDEKAMHEDLHGVHHHPGPDAPFEGPYHLNELVRKAEGRWQGFEADFVVIENYGCENMVLEVKGSLLPSHQFVSPGVVAFHVKTGRVEEDENPMSPDYAEAVPKLVDKLHFGNFGNVGVGAGYLLKFVYFFLALLTCFVILTGVLIWLEARNRKNISERRKTFNRYVGYSYMAICLSLFPVIPFSLAVSKLLPEVFNDQRETTLNLVFFGGWLVLALFLFLKKDHHFSNRFTLLTGGLLSLILPLLGGFSEGNWPWLTFSTRYYDIFAMDMLWLITAALCLFAVRQIDRRKKSSAF